MFIITARHFFYSTNNTIAMSAAEIYIFFPGIDRCLVLSDVHTFKLSNNVREG